MKEILDLNYHRIYFKYTTIVDIYFAKNLQNIF